MRACTCVHACICKESRGNTLRFHSSAASHLFFPFLFRVSHCPVAYQVGWPASEPGLLSVSVWDYKYADTTKLLLLLVFFLFFNLIFLMGSEDWTRVLLFARQALTLTNAVILQPQNTVWVRKTSCFYPWNHIVLSDSYFWSSVS